MDEAAEWAARSRLLRATAEHVPAAVQGVAENPAQRDRLEAMFPET
jgi:hypothetical protein